MRRTNTLIKKMNYQEFIESKKHSTIDYGIKTLWLPEDMFDFQKYITEITIKKGRYANFLDTGTGKTIMELTTDFNYVSNSPFNSPFRAIFSTIQVHERILSTIPCNDISGTGTFCTNH